MVENKEIIKKQRAPCQTDRGHTYIEKLYKGADHVIKEKTFGCNKP